MTNFFFKIKKIKKKVGLDTIIPQKISPFSKIVYDLKTISPWPEKTNVCCWYCTRNFNSKPIGIPYKYDNEVFYVKGCFCCFKCAWTYNKYNESSDKWRQESLLTSLYMYLGNTKLPIGEAPPKEIMITYGGTYTFEEYEKILDGDYVINIRYPPIVSLIPSISVMKLTTTDQVFLTVDPEKDPEPDQKKEYRFSRKMRLISTD